MIHEMDGPDPLRGRLALGRRPAALKGWRTRKAMAKARHRHQQASERHDDCATIQHPNPEEA